MSDDRMPGPRLSGHDVGGWVCSVCGVTTVADDGVSPSFEVFERSDGELLPALVLTARDGHFEVVTLGWDDLQLLGEQVISAQAEDPVRGPSLLRLMPTRLRLLVAADVARARAERARRRAGRSQRS